MSATVKEIMNPELHNVRTRLLDLVSLPQESAELRGWLEHRKNLRFRAAAVSDPGQREHLRNVLRADLRRSPMPAHFLMEERQ
jgi:hypothetical protein